MDTVSAPETVNLELDDIQGGVLHPRPSPYVGTYLLLRIDDRGPGGSCCGGCTRWSTPAGPPPTSPGAWVTVAFTYQGLKALGVPQESLDSFAPEFRQGMAARAAELGDVGESGPANWETPFGTADVHVAMAALSPDAARLATVVERARRAHQDAARGRGDLASGLTSSRRGAPPSASGTASASRRSRAAASPAPTRGSRRSRRASSSSATPTRRANLPPMPSPEVLGRNGTYVVFRKLHTRVAA